MRSLAQRLIAEELRASSPPDATESRAALRVCEKLRRPLSNFAGVAGFRSLLLRALALAKVEAPLLGGLKVKPDGTPEYSTEFEAQLDSKPGAQASAALVEQLLALLITFIGEALTLRVVHDVWPRAALKDPKFGGKQL
ncbi:MAG TPA: hypothetical protein VHO24_07670 [Opitutaceae bacterium]|nr:hypothetical protein [Opitutaceae bacterium]